MLDFISLPTNHPDVYQQMLKGFLSEHREDNKKVKQKFNNVIESIYQEISCNPFQMASLSTINNSNPFPQSVSDQLKQVLSTGERQFKALFRIGC